MNPFPSRICPLCSKKLVVGDENSAHTYYCSEFYIASLPSIFITAFPTSGYEWVRSGIKMPHYWLDVNNDGQGPVWTQSVIVMPFWILSNSETKKSQIFKMEGKIIVPSKEQMLMEIDLLSADNYLPEKLSQKIKNLVIFS